MGTSDVEGRKVPSMKASALIKRNAGQNNVFFYKHDNVFIEAISASRKFVLSVLGADFACAVCLFIEVL